MTDPSSTPVGRSRDRREVLRLVAGIVVILSFIALATIAIAASRSDFSISAPASASEPVGELPDVPEIGEIAQPLLTRPSTFAALPPAPAAAPVDTTSTTLAEGPPQPDPVVAGKPCAQLGLPAPQQVGGLQSLVRLIPLFGPFSPEAFALMPAFQPGFEVLGPLFPMFEDGLDAAAPVLDGATPLVQQLGEAGFGVLAPLYGPYREPVLAGEAQLAAFLQPILASLAEAPGTECFIALEALLVSLQPGLSSVG